MRMMLRVKLLLAGILDIWSMSGVVGAAKKRLSRNTQLSTTSSFVRAGLGKGVAHDRI
jgi:hypothetical protein